MSQIEITPNPDKDGFTVKLPINAPLGEVFDVLRLPNMPKIHPLIISMDVTLQTETHIEATVVDRLAMMGFPMKVRYQATSTWEADMEAGQVSIRNTGTTPFMLPGTTFFIDNALVLTATSPQTTLLTETSQMTFPAKPFWIPAFIWSRLTAYAFHNALDSHIGMFTRARDLLEA